jgi:hypothetical protein
LKGIGQSKSNIGLFLEYVAACLQNKETVLALIAEAAALTGEVTSFLTFVMFRTKLAKRHMSQGNGEPEKIGPAVSHNGNGQLGQTAQRSRLASRARVACS